MKIGRFLETIRWLRPVQIYGRLFKHVRLGRAPRITAATPRSTTGTWSVPARRLAAFADNGQPRFLNRVGKIDEPSDWNASDVPRLWLYNLHYFDDLNARDAENRRSLHRDLIQRWVDENPPFAGTGWEPYPCSLRIVNWIKWSLAGNTLEPEWRQSLTLQAAWLIKHIEWHLLGNHLFANAKALVLAGLFFEGEQAASWLKKGLRILERELSEQILDDGGQFELSPMYHSIATEDMLDLLNAAQSWTGLIPVETVEKWRNTVSKMLRWAFVMRHPDGKIVLFNDSAFNIAPDLEDIFGYSRRLGIEVNPPNAEVQHVTSNGYVRADKGDAVLFADISNIGPDYLPGHAHADTLGFELSLFRERWFVDTGCSTYEVGDERLRQRGTAAHNTVCVNGADSSEVWSSFRVARRANPMQVSPQLGGDKIVISAAHDGYKRLRGGVTHNRSFELSESKLEISDWLDGRFATAEANLLLHPEVTVERSDDALILRRKGRAARLSFDSGHIEVLDSSWHPEFGLSLRAKRIRVQFAQSSLNTTIDWGNSK